MGVAEVKLFLALPRKQLGGETIVHLRRLGNWRRGGAKK